ncbi:MAG: hypothetical protein ACM30I_07265 [Gemmatimonas sp.]
MTVIPQSLKRAAAVGILAAAALAVLLGGARAATTAAFNVAASINETCSLTAAPDSSLATNLVAALTSTGAKTVTLGTVTQTCNNGKGFTLTVSSTNCSTTTIGSLTAPSGAKLVNAGQEYQLYSVAFTNPSGINPTGLLASSCTPATGADFSKKATGQVSTIRINFTTAANGNTGEIAGAGTFFDTLTINLQLK